MYKFYLSLTLFICLLFFTAGCRSAAETVCQSTDGKNVSLDGYVMYGSADTADSTTGMPVGKLIIGRVAYKSRKVAIPADHKVPCTGNFKLTRNKSFFGTEEQIVEYDFTAGNDAEAAAALQRLEKISEKALAQ
jgi:hypothetical protein